MRRQDVALAISAGIVGMVIVIAVPGMQPSTRLLFDRWPVAVALLVGGLLIGRRTQGPAPRLIAAVGLAWLTFVGLVVGLLVALLILLAMGGGGIGP